MSMLKSSGLRFSAIAAVALVMLLVASIMLPAGGAGAASAASASSQAAPTVSTAATPATPTVTAPASTSPHPNQLDIYEVAPDGATSIDPAQAYDTVSFEPILNTYQTLIAYNGSSTATFVPELATCVPGSAACMSLYDSSMIVNDTYFTFAIDSAARFYDPATQASWPVFPSDVMFSLARTMAFAQLPAVGADGDWIQTQALLPYGNGSWDGGIHSPWNNTPENVLGSMLVNDSTYCPAAAMTDANGCITFIANGSGQSWPFFLELIADALGAGIVPCGWFTAQDAGVPGFLGAGNPAGDGPCLLPGGATSTNSTAFQSYLSGLDPTYWDTFESLGNNWPAAQPNVQWNAVGSGPYYISGTVSKLVGYTLKANPAYAAPTGCAGQPGCQPEPGTYQAEAIVAWEASDTVGLQEYAAGQADFAGIYTTHTTQMLQLVSEGKIWYTTFPTLSIFFMPFTFNFSLANEQIFDSVSTPNIPTDFFGYSTVRELMANAWPYATIQSTVNTVDGVEFGVQYGGVIPIGMGNYYPTNISWPSGDPVADPSVVGSAAWWWAQGINSSSAYYDAELAACTSGSPCKFPVIGQLGAPQLDTMIQLFISEIESITGGAVQPYTFDLSFSDLLQQFGYTPGTAPFPFYNLGWAPDYPDPTDYMAPMYQPDQTYTSPDAVAEVLAEPQFNSATCGHNTSSWSDLVYWANIGQIPTVCQGVAYSTMSAWMSIAGPLPAGAQRVLEYNLIEHIANTLALYIYYSQTTEVFSGATWIDESSINENPTIGGGGDQLWFNVQYAPPPVSLTFTESGLAAGTNWSVTLTTGSQTVSSTTSTIVFSVTPGTYNYLVNLVSGYAASPAAGSVVVNASAGGSAAVAFTAVSTGYPVSVVEGGLIWGTPYTVVVNNYGAIQLVNGLASFNVAAGNYTFYTLYTGNYTATSPVSGALTVTTAGAALSLQFQASYGACGCELTYPVTLQPGGIPAGTSWTATVSGFGGATFDNTTTASSAVFWELNGTTSYSLDAGAAYNTPSGNLIVAGTPVTFPVVFSPVFTVTFTETGLSGGTWWVSINGLNQSASTTTISFSLTNGTYTYYAGAPGQFASPGSNSFTVVGTPLAQSVTLASNSGPSSSSPAWTYLSTLAYIVIAVLVVLLIIALAIGMMGRGKAPANAPQTWDEPKSGSGGSTGGSGGASGGSGGSS